MANLLRYEGYGLPFYDTSEIVWRPQLTSASIRAQHSRKELGFDPEGEGFVRHVRIGVPGASGLTDALRIADEVLEHTASHFGARLLRHEWGLSEPPSGQPVFAEFSGSGVGSRRLLPMGKVLVARVETLPDPQDIDFPDDEYMDIDRLFDSYPGAARRSGLHHSWIDSKYDAFVTDTPAGSYQPERIMVDMEPWVDPLA